MTIESFNWSIFERLYVFRQNIVPFIVIGPFVTELLGNIIQKAIYYL